MLSLIFDFFYSEYWHYRLVLSFCAKAEVYSFEGRVGMRLSDYVVRVLIYCNLPGLLHRIYAQCELEIIREYWVCLGVAFRKNIRRIVAFKLLKNLLKKSTILDL